MPVFTYNQRQVIMSKVKEFKTLAKALVVPNHTFQKFDKDVYTTGGWYVTFKHNTDRHRKFSIHFDGDDLFPQTEYMGEPLWYPMISGISTQEGFAPALKACLELAAKYL